jgi:hypothetical protein
MGAFEAAVNEAIARHLAVFRPVSMLIPVAHAPIAFHIQESGYATIRRSVWSFKRMATAGRR